MYPVVEAPPILDGPVLNPEPGRRVNGAARIGAEILDAARELPDPAALERLRALTAGLHTLDPLDIRGDDNRLAFWINLYNALSRHALHAEGASGSLLKHLGIFKRAAYRVGAWRFSLDAIEHGLLRGNARTPPLRIFRALRRSDLRLQAAPSVVDPRIHFALNCGARSCPPIRHYLSGEIDAQLDTATGAYFASEASLDRDRGALTLPRLMKIYRRDFGDRIAFAAKHLSEPDASFVKQNASTLTVRYASYDWTIA